MKSISNILFTFFLFVCALNASEQSLFDGKSLDGWVPVNKNNAKYWSVVDGVITASNNGKKMPVNTYLATEKMYQNFEFKCKFRLSGDHKTGLINSGIQYRSLLKRIQAKSGVNKIIGYQADIGKGWWGGIYDEHRRGLLGKGNTKELFKNFKEDAWNEYIIRCIGNKHELFINGHKTIEYIEKDSNIESYGVIALQLHSGGIAKMEYKDISIKELPPSNMSLPLFLGPQETTIHGKTLSRRGNMIVSWNKTHEFLEWQIPGHFKSGHYKIIFHYMNDKNRQGSEMMFSGGLQEKSFLTKSQRSKWGPEQEELGVFAIQPGNRLKLYCTKLKADWVLDFLRLEFIPVNKGESSKLTYSIYDTEINGKTLKRGRGMIVSWNKTNEYLE